MTISRNSLEGLYANCVGGELWFTTYAQPPEPLSNAPITEGHPLNSPRGLTHVGVNIGGRENRHATRVIKLRDRNRNVVKAPDA